MIVTVYHHAPREDFSGVELTRVAANRPRRTGQTARPAEDQLK